MRSDIKRYYDSIRFDVLMEIIESYVTHPILLTLLYKALRRTETRGVLNALHFQLHTSKTYIGKVPHGFNFLGYYMDDQKILPSKETIRRFLTHITALYERSPGNRNVSRRYKRNPHGRDISEYQVNEPAPTDAYFKDILTHLLSKAALRPDTLATLRRYVGQWARLC